MAKGKKMLALIGWLYPGARLQKGRRDETGSGEEEREGMLPDAPDDDEDDDDDEFFGYAPV